MPPWSARWQGSVRRSPSRADPFVVPEQLGSGHGFARKIVVAVAGNPRPARRLPRARANRPRRRAGRPSRPCRPRPPAIRRRGLLAKRHVRRALDPGQVGMAADRAGRGAWRIEQHEGRGRVRPESRAHRPAISVAASLVRSRFSASRRSAIGFALDRDDLCAARRQLHGLAAGRGAQIDHRLARDIAQQTRRQRSRPRPAPTIRRRRNRASSSTRDVLAQGARHCRTALFRRAARRMPCLSAPCRAGAGRACAAAIARAVFFAIGVAPAHPQPVRRVETRRVLRARALACLRATRAAARR